MHSDAEAVLLAELAAGCRTVVELGVYEGGSAVVLCRALMPDATLHLVDPFIEGGSALRPGQRAVPSATRRVVERAARGGPDLRWHLDFSQRLAEHWSHPIDLVFIDGDHSAEGCRADWELWHPLVSERGIVAFHDARLSQRDGTGLPGPTAVVDAVFRGDEPHAGWQVLVERDSLVAVERTKPI
jgi:predicted O-methyltransferase YrrM